MQKHTVTFKHEKETKGAHRFQEINSDGDVLKPGEGALIGTLYIRKVESGIGTDAAPARLTVTVAASK